MGQPSLLLFMENINMMMILVIIISVYQSSLISATTGEDDIKTMIKKMKTTMEEKMSQTMTEMKTTIAMQDEKIAMQDKKIAELKQKEQKAEAFFCGYKNQVWEGTINYQSMFYERTNLPTGGLDLATGIFTSPIPGTYTVTWSLYSWNNDGREVRIDLYKNGERIWEAGQRSSSGLELGLMRDWGGSSLILHLDMGETLYLRHTEGTGRVLNVMFCTTLSLTDQIEA